MPGEPEDIIELEAEAAPVRVIRSPSQPTAADIELGMSPSGIGAPRVWSHPPQRMGIGAKVLPMTFLHFVPIMPL